jgi:hypothetical protein
MRRAAPPHNCQWAFGPFALITLYRYKTDENNTRNSEPIYGNAYALVNLMFARSFPLNPKVRMRVQLNLDNLPDEDDPVVVDADQVRAYRVILQTPRRWALTTTFTFREACDRGWGSITLSCSAGDEIRAGQKEKSQRARAWTRNQARSCLCRAA